MFATGKQIGIKSYDSEGGVVITRGLFQVITNTHIFVTQPRDGGVNIVAKPHDSYFEVFQMVDGDN